jgi:OOP family OmpA-OmpF porin
MRKLVIGLAMASSALAAPALAKDKSWYVQVEGGPMIVEDMSFKVQGVGTPSKLDSKTGYDFGGVVGYDFGMFRLESEASYRRANADNYTVNGYSMGKTSVGHVDALSFMVNGLLDFGPDDGLQGFVGGGVGVARIRAVLNGTGASGINGAVNDSDTGFAWQALAGVRAPISSHWDAGLEYRFFNEDNVNLVLANGRPEDTRYRSHSLMGTLTYNFGSPTPPPPAPVCNKGPYIVFFDWDKSDITPEAATILDSAITAYGNCQSVPIMLAGYADRSGTPKYNVGLSNRRNASVQTYLAGHGVPATAITAQGFGEANPRVPTADGVRELQNRRVEITYGPGSGM